MKVEQDMLVMNPETNLYWNGTNFSSTKLENARVVHGVPSEIERRFKLLWDCKVITVQPKKKGRELRFRSAANETRTVGELARTLYPGRTYDTALPQHWVDAMRERGFDVRGHFVWEIQEVFGRPLPLTVEGIEALSAVAWSG